PLNNTFMCQVPILLLNFNTSRSNTLTSAIQCASRRLAAGDAAGSGAGGHEGGEDVVRVTVEVLASTVVAHRGAGIGVTGGDLDIAQVDARVEHGGNECVAQHVRVCPASLDAGGCCELSQAAGGGVPVHPGAAAVE